ncbi:MAG TPA: cytochrome C oxidase subunit IV family protein [Anaerolinea sp.]|nr:cytochrome C oxidase subunit IV family protein [Anaerolinea sp.]
MEHKEPVKKQDELRRGVLVFIALAVLTAIEYFIGTHEAPVIFMWIIALAKAGLVVWYFMHVKRAFSDEGGH